jgi:hypothetical protein
LIRRLRLADVENDGRSTPQEGNNNAEINTMSCLRSRRVRRSFADEMMMKNGSMMMMMPDGKMMTMTPSADQMKMAEDAMMKHGAEMKAPVMMMMHDGHMMMMN